jgi:eukaryotic-like serine/threonine-protein kinase
LFRVFQLRISNLFRISDFVLRISREMRMPRVLSCPNGHRWEEADARLATGAGTRCPICGADGGPGTAESHDADSSTVLHGPAWQPLPPLKAETPPTIPDYEVLGELGRGGMGVVYKARHAPDAQVIALKVIRKDRLADEEAVRRFRREAQAAARASHPNIVRVIDSDHTGDTHYLVMEFVDGITLQRLVDERGPLPVEQACDFMRQAAEGLQHAHEQALVHRDIKPSNLMVACAQPHTTPDCLVKILDLGVARLLPAGGATPGESLSTLTQGGAVIGTADYVAPEQLEDPHGADIRADLYSLGCTFYFLLTGKVPFPGGTLISKLDKQRWQTPEPVEALRAELPPAVVSVVHKLMAKKPADRYQSPGELARVLQAMARTGYRGGAADELLVQHLRIKAHADIVWSACFSPDGGRIASAGKDRGVVLWEAVEGAQLRTLPTPAQEVRAVAFAGESGRLVTASGLTVRLWNADTGIEVQRFSGHAGPVRCVAPCEDGQRLLSGGEDRTVRVWEVQTGREVLRYNRHTAGVTCLAPIPGTTHAVSGSRDQTLRQWDLRSGHDIRVLAPASGAVLAVAVSHDGRLAASAHFDTVIRLWDLRTGGALRRCAGHRQMVTSLAFTPDGRWLLSGSQDQTVRLWDVETAAELSCVETHAGGINAVAINSDGKTALAAGSDGTVCVYQVAS